MTWKTKKRTKFFHHFYHLAALTASADGHKRILSDTSRWLGLDALQQIENLKVHVQGHVPMTSGYE